MIRILYVTTSVAGKGGLNYKRQSPTFPVIVKVCLKKSLPQDFSGSSEGSLGQFLFYLSGVQAKMKS